VTSTVGVLGAGNAKYTSWRFIQQALECIATYTKACYVVPKLKESALLGVVVDEASIQQRSQLLVYYRAVLNGQPTMLFGGLEQLPNKTGATIEKAIRHRLYKDKVSIKKVGSFGSDGASAMAGVRNGVAARLLKLNPLMIFIHCICHRHALASQDAAKVPLPLPCLQDSV
jgi:hypothetical protein